MYLHEFELNIMYPFMNHFLKGLEAQICCVTILFLNLLFLYLLLIFKVCINIHLKDNWGTRALIQGLKVSVLQHGIVSSIPFASAVAAVMQ